MTDFKVLLVDDEKDFRSTLLKRLRHRGLDVADAGSGEEALDYLAGNQADVVLLDVKMPGMGGVAALVEIRRLHPDVEVVMLTGHADMEAAINGLEQGAFDYLMKPMDIDVILFKLQDAYKRRQLNEQARQEKEGKQH